jgi:3-oxoacyl-[acyl-carrier protein] reductase
LKDSVHIVTGSATGIGAACALRLAAKGARIAINYSRSEREARETAAACEAAGGKVIVVRGDVSSDADCRKLAEATLTAWGRIDGLINNAGTTKFVEHANLDGLDAVDFQRIFGVNVIGPFQMIRAVAAAMQRQGRGAVVNISSIGGIMGDGSSVAYAASKGALNTMTLSLARALGPAIRVNTVCPGLVDTRWGRDALGDAAFEKRQQVYSAGAPLRSVVSADDVADAAIWLLESAAKVTGELISVDSGWHLGAAAMSKREP